MVEENFVDVDLKKKADEGIAGIKKDLFVDSVLNYFFKIFPFVIVFLIAFFIGNNFNAVNNSSNDLDEISSMVYAGSECSLRSTQSVVWIPNMIVQSDVDGNITGIPICVPVDRNSGVRLKK